MVKLFMSSLLEDTEGTKDKDLISFPERHLLTWNKDLDMRIPPFFGTTSPMLWEHFLSVGFLCGDLALHMWVLPEPSCVIQ